MNRYDDITVAKFNPLSMQEIMMVPMIKRKQHDDLIAQQELIKQGLAKVDPLDKHYGEALRLKNELESKIDGYANKLSKEGVNTQMTGEMIALNRDYQNKVGPMGAIGQINAAKKAYEEESANYLKQATAMKYSPETVQKHLSTIQAKYNQDPIYDKNGKVTALKIDELPPNYLNHIDEAERFYKGMGMDKTDWSRAVSGVELDPSTGRYISASNAGGTEKNINQRNAVINFLNDRVLNTDDDLRKSLDYQEVTPQKALDDIKNMSGIYARNGRSDSTTYSVAAPEKGKDNEDVVSTEGVPYNTREIGNTEEEYDELDKIGTNISTGKGLPSSSGFGDGSAGRSSTNTNVNSTKLFTPNDIKDPILRERYLDEYQDLIKSGKLKVGSMNDDPITTTKMIKASLKAQGPITLTSSVIKSDMALNSLGFPGTLTSKDNKERSESIQRDINQNVRQVIDPDTGKEMSGDAFMKKYPGATIEYYGYTSPHNWEDHNWGNKEDQNIAPNKITVSYKDGDETKSFTTVASRHGKETNTKDFQASKTLNKTYKKATLRPNKFVNLQTDNPRLKGIKVMYNTKVEGEPPMFDLIIGGKPARLTEDQYIRLIYEQYDK